MVFQPERDHLAEQWVTIIKGVFISLHLVSVLGLDH